MAPQNIWQGVKLRFDIPDHFYVCCQPTRAETNAPMVSLFFTDEETKKVEVLAQKNYP